MVDGGRCCQDEDKSKQTESASERAPVVGQISTLTRNISKNLHNDTNTMSYRPLPSHIRPSSGLATSNLNTSTQSSALQARINEKKAELESLKQLRDLSAGLAGQMQQLEEKLSTLSDGTQAVAEVLSNWNGVLRAVYMASGAFLLSI